MEIGGNTVLITGGASGIGLALAQRFVEGGSEVIVCGRREQVLREVEAKLAGVQTRVCDVSRAEERQALFEWAVEKFPRLNVLINNAGIQRRLQLDQLSGQEEWGQTRQEIAINVEAPIHLATLFIPQLLQQPQAAILNVTSGLAFAPLANVPVYCATKAALRSFTLSLRHQLSATPIEVIEIIPPAVNTDLGGVGLHTFGEPVDEFADAVMTRLALGETEIAYGSAARSSCATREELDEIARQMNRTVAVPLRPPSI